ncbi:MAG: hypothetical protein WDN49_03870 [Acetobacteraceae bacterium]
MVSKILMAALAISLSAAGAASAGELWNATAPSNGGNGEVVSPNSLPPGFMDGTEAGVRAQALARWFNAQGEHAYAASQAAQPNG